MIEPLEFIIPGQIPALKNNRIPVLDKSKRFRGTRPHPRIEKFIRTAKDKIRRQLPTDFEVIKRPTEVGVYIELGVYSASYPSTLPQSDMDNAATTLQECLFTAKQKGMGMGPVLEDDNQVAFLVASRNIISFKEGLYSRVFVWTIGENPIEEFMEVLGVSTREF